MEAFGGEEGKTAKSYQVRTKQELSSLLDDPTFGKTEVIQLVEVSAPPQATHPSTITTSSVPSSSAYTESCSEESEADEEEESAVSSYCSSDEGDEAARAYYDDTYGTRIKRVLAWRDGAAKALGALGTFISATLRVGLS